MVVIIIYLFTIVGNLLVILLVQADTCLHKPMYFFLSHLSGLEICYVTSTMPQILAHLLSGNGAITFAGCAAQMYMLTCLVSTECLLLGAMAYDRYVAICHPLLYAIAMGRSRQLQLTSASWAGGFLLASIDVACTLRLPFCGSNRIDHFVCEVPVLLKLACTDVHVMEVINFVLAGLVLLVPLSVILTSYGLIISSVVQMPSTTGRHKAFSTCASHMIVVIMFYGTGIFMYLIPHSKTAPNNDKQIAAFYILVSPLLNPIIYTLRNKDVHGAVAKVLQSRRFELKK